MMRSRHHAMMFALCSPVKPSYQTLNVHPYLSSLATDVLF